MTRQCEVPRPTHPLGCGPVVPGRPCDATRMAAGPRSIAGTRQVQPAEDVDVMALLDGPPVRARNDFKGVEGELRVSDRVLRVCTPYTPLRGYRCVTPRAPHPSDRTLRVHVRNQRATTRGVDAPRPKPDRSEFTVIDCSGRNHRRCHEMRRAHRAQCANSRHASPDLAPARTRRAWSLPLTLNRVTHCPAMRTSRLGSVG